MKNLKVTLTIIALPGLGLWGAMLKLIYNHTSPSALLVHLGKTGATLTILTVLGTLVRQVFLERDKEEERRIDCRD